MNKALGFIAIAGVFIVTYLSFKEIQKRNQTVKTKK